MFDSMLQCACVCVHTCDSILRWKSSSAPSVLALMVAQVSSRMHMIPGGRFSSINSHTTLLSKYVIGFHWMPCRKEQNSVSALGSNTDAGFPHCTVR